MANHTADLLVRSGLVGTDAIRRAQEAAADHGSTLSESLVLHGDVDDELLTRFYHKTLMVPRVNPNLLAKITPKMIMRIPADMALEFRIVPVSLDRDKNLTLAMSDPSNTHAVDEIAFFTGCYVMRAVATQRQIAWCLAHYYGHVTELGQTLLRPAGDGSAPPGETDKKSEPESAVARVLKDAGMTARIEASRHRVRAPVAATPAPGSHPVTPAVDPSRDTAAQAGELDADSERHVIPASASQSLPAVVVEESSLQSDRLAPQGTPEPSPAASANDEDAEPVLLLRKKKRPKRTSKETEVGLGQLGANEDSRSTTGSIPQVVADQDTELHKSPAPSGASRQHYDDGFGPPGSTIPPGLLGPIPFDKSTAAATEIPISLETPAADKTPTPQEPAANTDVQAPGLQELEQSSLQLVETLRAMDRAQSRDDVIQCVLQHLAHAFEEVGFLAVRKGELMPFRRLHGVPSDPSMRLDLREASTFTHVVRARLPFHGELTDSPSVALATAIVGVITSEVFAMPVMVAERVVGVVCANGSTSRVFPEHIAVVTRAAGLALEKVVKSKKPRHIQI